MRILVTGAAGFIGSAVCTALDGAGHEVVGVDQMIPQAHAVDTHTPAGVSRVDVRDPDALAPLLRGVDVVSHQAAMVGAGVTVADLPLYASHNDLGTAVLLAAMSRHRVARLVLASSMVVYGDGRYVCATHGPQRPPARSLRALSAGRFDPGCPTCCEPLGWEAVDEDAPLDPRSSYAVSKLAQEHYARVWSRQAPASVVALRYHNVYGPGMPRDTPYSGVAALFRSAVERGRPPRVFEDGLQMRDFVHVGDVAAANAASVLRVAADPVDSCLALNVCSGQPIAVGDVARLVSLGARRAGLSPRGGAGDAVDGTAVEPVVTGEFRVGDVRHIVASPERARREVGFVAQTSPGAGLRAFATAPLR